MIWTAEDFLKSEIKEIYRQMAFYKKQYHKKGSLNNLKSPYMQGVVDQMRWHIDDLQRALSMIKEEKEEMRRYDQQKPFIIEFGNSSGLGGGRTAGEGKGTEGASVGKQ